MDKKSFIIFDNWARLFTELPTEEAGILIKMLCNYKLGKEVDTDNQTVYAMFMMMKMAMDESDKIYQEKCEKNRINASKGGKQKVENAKKNVANGSERLANGSDCYRTEENATQIVANPSITDTDTDTDNNGSINTTIPPKLDWIKKYCEERESGIDAEQFFDYYEKRGWKVSNNEPMKDWKAMVRYWEERRKTNKVSRYDFKALQKFIEGG